MFEWLVVIGQLAGALTAIGAVVSAVWVCAKRPWRQVRRTIDQVEVMSKALGENGGASLADEIRRQGTVQREQGITLRLTAAKIEAVVDLNDRPVFQTDHQGHWVRVNRAFDLTFGYPPGDVLGMGWVSLTAVEDRARLLETWNYAINDKRAFRGRTKLMTRSGVQLICDIVANPIVVADTAMADRAAPVLINWFGSIQIIVVKQPTTETSHP